MLNMHGCRIFFGRLFASSCQKVMISTFERFLGHGLVYPWRPVSRETMSHLYASQGVRVWHNKYHSSFGRQVGHILLPALPSSCALMWHLLQDGRISYEEFAAMMKAGTDWRKASRQYSRERFSSLSLNLIRDGSLQLANEARWETVTRKIVEMKNEKFLSLWVF